MLLVPWKVLLFFSVYFDPHWSLLTVTETFAQFALLFSNSYSIQKLPRLLVVNLEGVMYIYNLDPNESGECQLVRQHRYLLLCCFFCFSLYASAKLVPWARTRPPSSCPLYIPPSSLPPPPHPLPSYPQPPLQTKTILKAGKAMVISPLFFNGIYTYALSDQAHWGFWTRMVHLKHVVKSRCTILVWDCWHITQYFTNLAE